MNKTWKPEEIDAYIGKKLHAEMHEKFLKEFLVIEPIATGGTKVHFKMTLLEDWICNNFKPIKKADH